MHLHKTQHRFDCAEDLPDADAARLALMRGEIDVVTMGVSADGMSATEVATKTRYQESGWCCSIRRRSSPQIVCRTAAKRVVVSLGFFAPADGGNRRRNAGITFVEDERHDDEALIAAVGDDDVQYAIVEEDTFNASRHFHYDAQRAFTVQPALSRVWLFGTKDMKLRDEARHFSRITRDGQIARVLDRYFGFPQRVSPMDIDIFSERVNSVLPRYRMWFQQAQGDVWHRMAVTGGGVVSGIALECRTRPHRLACAASYSSPRIPRSATTLTGSTRDHPFSVVPAISRAQTRRPCCAHPEPKTWLALAALPTSALVTSKTPAS